MQRSLLLLSATLLLFGCTRKDVYNVQSFTPILVNMAKIEEKEYQELIDAVNTNYAPSTNEFIEARLLSEQDMFLYFHVYSGKDNGCYRVTIDKNRKKIVNMQPDCSIEID